VGLWGQAIFTFLHSFRAIDPKISCLWRRPYLATSFINCGSEFKAALATNGIVRSKKMRYPDDWTTWRRKIQTSIVLDLLYHFPLMKSRATRSFWKQFPSINDHGVNTLDGRTYDDAVIDGIVNITHHLNNYVARGMMAGK